MLRVDRWPPPAVLRVFWYVTIAIVVHGCAVASLLKETSVRRLLRGELCVHCGFGANCHCRRQRQWQGQVIMLPRPLRHICDLTRCTGRRGSELQPWHHDEALYAALLGARNHRSSELGRRRCGGMPRPGRAVHSRGMAGTGEAAVLWVCGLAGRSPAAHAPWALPVLPRGHR